MFESKDLQHHKNKYYGLYRGYVYDNKDPKGMGRLRICCPSILGVDDETSEPLVSDWAYPKFPLGGNGWGLTMIPPLKNPDKSKVMVWVEFEKGDINKPVWSGSPIPMNGLSDIMKSNHGKVIKGESTKVVFGFTTPDGLAVILNDANKTILINDANGNSVKIEDGKGMVLSTRNNRVIDLNDDKNEISISDANGNSLKMSPDTGISITTSKVITITTQNGTQTL